MTNDKDYSSGESTNFSDLELEPVAGEITEVNQELVSIEIPEQFLIEEPEPASLLTAERLLQEKAKPKSVPETFWRKLIYFLSFKAFNPGNNSKVLARKALDARISAKLVDGTKFVPVLTRKGGVGKTTVTALMGMALADIREDRVLAIDANPDRGTLSERVPRGTTKTVRDLVNKASSITGFSVFSDYVSRDKTRLDVLASDPDPMVSEAFNEGDYNVVADISARYYSVCLTDCGTGIVHSVMRAILQRADSLVIVSGGSVDEAKLASETLTWLEANGYGDLVKDSVVALNTGTYGTQLIKLDEIVSHFTSRVRAVVTIPYDKHLAAGAEIDFDQLHPATRLAARELAALVMDGLSN
jgi:MinD-like ATPase involved in chromosome partitioning or flagellar assembly